VRLEASIGEVGNHTWSHRSLTDLANERVVGQFVRTQNALERVTGKRPHLYRPPFEAHNFRVDGIAAGLGLLTELWNVDSGDASVASTPSAEVVFRNLVRRVRPGAIVLMHEDETVSTTVRALRRFLPELRRRGLDAVSGLVTRDPPDAQELPNGSGGCNSTWHR
jgi:peptidoglycan/xylan/chitin deacetylase (PgdA/CDA1 family)